MQQNQPKTIYLKDYQPSDFEIESISLSVDIYDEKTIIHSLLKVSKAERILNKTASLVLNGEGLKLINLKLNGEVLSPHQYHYTDHSLTILDLTFHEFTVEITNEIDPANNKACEGLYQSGAQLCTQCEPEGFRKITYHIDRPDIMPRFKTKMIADKKKFPFLLSNGNRISQGDLPEGRHYVEWEDPFKKPSYLFAMVAGDFDVARDTFKTMSGRTVDLEIYVDKGNLSKTSHAMNSLKKAMKWDEETYGLEYDLDIYMIVAVNSFNSGAMENKGLNIFNSTYALADEASATDFDFQNIEGVIGHEYFHNWTGNRVTCRDWFQLTLKEGLTVYRDQEFSSDIFSRSVKRIDDVRLLKELQFPEDAGPLSHPIRPASYIEINNFYTRTIYEKGAEVIRMIETLIGKENFKKGMKKYFELFDGKAVTTDDFIHAMELASGVGLKQFKNWYSRSGTPIIKVDSRLDSGELKIEFQQKYPQSQVENNDQNILHMPFKIGLLYSNGKVDEYSIELKQMSQSFSFKTDQMPILSLNRSFSAPVYVDYEYQFSDLLKLMSYDTDAYCRYEATQKVYDSIFRDEFTHFKNTGTAKQDLNSDFSSALSKLLEDEKIDLSYKSFLLDLPTENFYSQEMSFPEFETIHLVRKNLQKKIGGMFQQWFIDEYDKLARIKQFDLSPEGHGRRALKNQILSYLVASGSSQGLEKLDDHYFHATNMTEEIFGLNQYILTGAGLDHKAVRGFYEKWKHDSLVMIKWFASVASFSPESVAIERLKVLEKDKSFLKDVPNYLRALYGQFAKNNLPSFHAFHGEGYDFIADRILMIDQFNPQVASRIAGSYSLINRLDPSRQSSMKKALGKILQATPSQDTYEVVSKFLC